MQFDKPIDPRISGKYLSWDVFRRKQLENICKLEKLYIKDGATHNEMKIILDSNNINPWKYANIVFLGALHGDTRDPRPETLETEVRALPIKQVIKDVNFQKMKMYELRQECSLQGIEWAKTDKKVDLIKKIEERMNGLNAAARS